MADPTGTLEPRPGDSSNMLLQKILLNLADLPGTFITPAEGDLRYLKLTGGTLTGVANTNLNTTLSTPWFAGPMLTGANTTNTAYQIDSYGAQARYDIRRASGTKAAPTALLSGEAIGGLAARGYNGTAYTGTTGSLLFTANGNWSGTNYGTIATIAIVPGGQITQVAAVTLGNGNLLEIGNNATFSSWTTSGVVLKSTLRTYTDNTSTGTVAATNLHSFAASTIAATNATTFTDAANLYIAGDVAAGTNVTLTNSYGLWNVGKTRLDGTTYQFAVGYGPTFFGRRANGSLGAPTAVTNGQQLLDLSGGGYSGSGWVDNAAFVGLYATENWSASALGSKFAVGTTPIGSTTAVTRLLVDSAGSVILNSAAIATTATDGFLYVAACAGAPTGVPTAVTGRIPIVVDSANHKLYFYSGGAWRDAGP